MGQLLLMPFGQPPIKLISHLRNSKKQNKQEMMLSETVRTPMFPTLISNIYQAERRYKLLEIRIWHV